MRTRIQTYNDGVAKFYAKKTDRNVRGLDDLEYLSRLAYQEKTMRQEDVEFAMQQNKKLALKITTPDDGNMDTERCAVIGNVIYGIIDIDRDRKNNELYFYLQEIRKID